ncbi:MAG: TonB family protein [Bacteroidaceae bacterium]
MAKIDLLSEEWCNLIFLDKNKNYGAFKLRAESGKRHTTSLIIVFALCCAIIIVPYLVKLATPAQNEESMTEVTTLSKLAEAKVKDEHIIKRVEPKKQEVQLIKSSIKFTAPVIKKDEEVTAEDEMKSQEELGESKVNISTADVVGNNEKEGKLIEDIKEVITSEVQKVYDVVEQPPTFPGGEAALLKFVNSHLKYPSIALEQGTEGRVMLRFVVTGSGEVGEVKVIKSLDSYCDREAIRVVKSLPRFIPGKQQGRAVSVWFMLPVVFQID